MSTNIVKEAFWQKISDETKASLKVKDLAAIQTEGARKIFALDGSGKGGFTGSRSGDPIIIPSYIRISAAEIERINNELTALSEGVAGGNIQRDLGKQIAENTLIRANAGVKSGCCGSKTTIYNFCGVEISKEAVMEELEEGEKTHVASSNPRAVIPVDGGGAGSWHSKEAHRQGEAMIR